MICENHEQNLAKMRRILKYKLSLAIGGGYAMTVIPLIDLGYESLAGAMMVSATMFVVAAVYYHE